ncbi:MAG: amino acid permease [Gammaproteobacteria bacterium]|nr:amino acid permease [Gammaproteobacteria bacterium]
MSLLRTKPINADLVVDTGLKRCLSALDLTLLGIGAIIGAGIFVLTGVAAATEAGPAIVLSYVVAGFACAFAALCYAELASAVGGCGSAYGYAYAGLGEIVAWMIGWDLILEYGVATPAVAIGWSGYVTNALSALNIALPAALTAAPDAGGIVNLPALLIILLLTVVLVIGVQVSARFNAMMVVIKLLAIAIFIAVAVFNVNPMHWQPFMPFGWEGVMQGAAFIFFAYIGFDAVSTAAEEAKNPQRDLPIGILTSLGICTVIYVVVAGLLTGIVPYTSLNVASPVAEALLSLGHRVAAGFIAAGAIAGLTTVMLVLFYALTRVILAMSRDGLLPFAFQTLYPKTQTPARVIAACGVLMALVAGFMPIDAVAKLVSIGTLAAFVMVCVGVLILRYTRPDLPRPFRIAFNPVVPVLGILSCGYLMYSLPLQTWLRFGVWLLIGLVVYFFYSRKNSQLAAR